MQEQLSLRTVMLVLLGKIQWVILSVLLCGALLASYAAFLVPQEYTSRVTLLVSNYATAEKDQNASASGLTASQMLANTYVVVLQDPVMLSRIRSQLSAPYKDTSDTALKAMMTMTVEQDTSALRIVFSGNDEAQVADVSRVVAEVAPTVLKEQVDSGSAKTLGSATAVKPVGRGIVKKGMIGALGGLMLSVAVILICFLLDNTVKSAEDIKQHIDVPVLGEIPSFSAGGKGGQNG